METIFTNSEIYACDPWLPGLYLPLHDQRAINSIQQWQDQKDWVRWTIILVNSFLGANKIYYLFKRWQWINTTIPYIFQSLNEEHGSLYAMHILMNVQIASLIADNISTTS